MAFGDSMTEGFLQPCKVGTLTRGIWSIMDDMASLRTVRPPQYSAVSYPVKLQSMLALRYAAQSITVINEGSGGETAAFGATQFASVLNQDQPQVVLLLEGINDIHGSVPQSNGIPIAVSSLRSMVQEAKRRGVFVFLATLLPERKGSCRSFDWDDGVEDVVPADSQIRVLAASENVPLVDMYPAFSPSLDTLIGVDGLHHVERREADLARASAAAHRGREGIRRADRVAENRDRVAVDRKLTRHLPIRCRRCRVSWPRADRDRRNDDARHKPGKNRWRETPNRKPHNSNPFRRS